MTLDLNRYRHAIKPYVEQMFKLRKGVHPLELISQIAASTHCPIIAVAHYAGELMGPIPGLEAMIASNVKFYRIKEVTNQQAWKGPAQDA